MSKENLPQSAEKPCVNCPHCGVRNSCENFVAHQAGFCPIGGQMDESFGRMYKRPNVLQLPRMNDGKIQPEKPKSIPEMGDGQDADTEIGETTEAAIDRATVFLRNQQGQVQPALSLNTVIEEFNADTIKFENHQATLEKAFDFEQTPSVEAFLKELGKMGKTGQVVLVDSTTNYRSRIGEKFSEYKDYDKVVPRPIAEIHTALSSAWTEIRPLLDKYPGRMIANVLTQKLSDRLGQGRLIAQTEHSLMAAIASNDAKAAGVYNFVDQFIKLLGREKK